MIMADACSKRGFQIFTSHDGVTMDIAVGLERRGLLSVSIAPTLIPGGPQMYGPNTEDRMEDRATYRATTKGRELFILGALSAW